MHFRRIAVEWIVILVFLTDASVLTEIAFILKSIKFFTSAVSSRNRMMPFFRTISPSKSLYFYNCWPKKWAEFIENSSIPIAQQTISQLSDIVTYISDFCHFCELPTKFPQINAKLQRPISHPVNRRLIIKWASISIFQKLLLNYFKCRWEASDSIYNWLTVCQ